ncbi:MAG: hypothetical protein H6741_09850 [Alphaproteobacteria bacterium]|nr:hypothetical protein [Alphaproteobacteria bacterium]MCB9793015.1 hypothetical protein [Alphaproteobacteria bacterium]
MTPLVLLILACRAKLPPEAAGSYTLDPSYVAPHCGVYEGQRFSYEHDFQRLSPLYPRFNEVVVTTPITLEVTEVSRGLSTLEARFEAPRIQGDTSELKRASEVYLALLTALGQPHTLTLTLDEALLVVAVDYDPALKGQMQGALEAEFARLSAQRQDRADARVLRNLQETLFDDDAVFEATLLRNLSLLLSLTCTGFSLEGIEPFEAALENPFGGPPIATVGHSEATLGEDRRVSVRQRQSVDPEGLTALFEEVFGALGEGTEWPDIDISELDYSESLRADIDLVHGFPVALEHRTLVLLPMIEREEVHSYRLLAYRPPG